MATVDLRDAYLLLPVNKQHRKYLRFIYEGRLYEYNAMPFGLNCGPLIFTKLMKPILFFLREKGYISVLYLDDFLLFGETYQDCLKNCTKYYNKHSSVPGVCYKFFQEYPYSLPTNTVFRIHIQFNFHDHIHFNGKETKDAKSCSKFLESKKMQNQRIC